VAAVPTSYEDTTAALGRAVVNERTPVASTLAIAGGGAGLTRSSKEAWGEPPVLRPRAVAASGPMQSRGKAPPATQMQRPNVTMGYVRGSQSLPFRLPGSNPFFIFLCGGIADGL
jgi:hypothetical protein